MVVQLKPWGLTPSTLELSWPLHGGDIWAGKLSYFPAESGQG